MSKKEKTDSGAAAPPPAKKPHTGIKLFFAAALIFLLGLSPLLITTGGVYFYSGDYGVQNMPMWLYYHQMFSEGLPAWDWLSDLGMNFIGSYTFYGLFSPYTLISLIVPYSALPYAITVINALKFGFAASGAYLYCRQYVKKEDSAFICGLLYAFSGYQIFNLVYHFAEIVSVFPFLLYSLDRLVKERRPVCFALAIAITGIMNYYFFWGTCVFLLIYFIVKTVCGEYIITKKLFGRLAAETLIGTGLTMFALLPSFFALLGNGRASNTIFSKNPLAFKESGTIWRIFQSMFFFPDICNNGIFFSGKQLDLSPPALFIPLFSVVGVISIFRREKKSWYARLLTVCGIAAVIPLFNSVFSAFNGNYYARWMYMPLLVMVMMTGKFIDGLESADIKKELIFSGAVVGVFALYALKFVFGGSWMSHYVIFMVVFSALSLLVMYCFTHEGKSSFFRAANVKKISCAFCAVPVLFMGCEIGSRNGWEEGSRYIDENYNGFNAIDTGDDSHYRVITTEKPYNDSTLNWGYPNIFLYNSCTPGTETDFYSLMGYEREQNIVLDNEVLKEGYALYALLSVKYDLYCNQLMVGGIEIEPQHILYYQKGFEQRSVQNRYVIYENMNYIPMGFTYDYYLPVWKADSTGVFDPAETENVLDGGEDEDESGVKISSKPEERARLMLKAIWLTRDLAEKYDDLLPELPESKISDTSYETFVKDCEERRRTAAYSFEPDKIGFTSKIELSRGNLVFYSVPYDESFSVTVDGQPAEMEKVFGGLTAVFVSAGDHTVRFDYTVRGLKAGIAASAASAGALIVYIIFAAVTAKRKDKE